MTPERLPVSIRWRRKVSLRSRLITYMNQILIEPRLARVRMDDPQSVRRLLALDQLASLIKPPPGTVVEPIQIGECAAEWIHAAGVPASRSGKIFLYYHGGGWFFGGLNTYRRMLTRFSAALGRPVLSVDYRMLPAVDFRTMIKDCVQAYAWLLGTGVKPADVCVAGDSAGGHLAFAVLVHARERGLPMPGSVVALSPCLDLDFTAKFNYPNALNSAASVRTLRELHRVFLSDLDTSDPLVSPIRADVRGFPPALLIVSSSETLYYDSELMANRLAQAGVTHQLLIWYRQIHVFPALGNLTPEAKAAIGEIAEFVNSHPNALKAEETSTGTGAE